MMAVYEASGTSTLCVNMSAYTTIAASRLCGGSLSLTIAWPLPCVPSPAVRDRRLQNVSDPGVTPTFLALM
jgi:hypothetical protein